MGPLLQVFDILRKTITAKYNKGYRFNEPVKCLVSGDSPHIKHKVEEAAKLFRGAWIPRWNFTLRMQKRAP